MRRKDETKLNGSGRVKFRFFELDMDGDTETLSEGLRSLANAISRGQHGTIPGE